MSRFEKGSLGEAFKFGALGVWLTGATAIGGLVTAFVASGISQNPSLAAASAFGALTLYCGGMTALGGWGVYQCAKEVKDSLSPYFKSPQP